jgi:hypothetical protein
MKLLLEKIQCEKCNWNTVGDLKVTVLLFGLQLGYTKFCCFVCEWESRNRKSYIQKHSPERESFIPGQKNVGSAPLINPDKVYLPPLLIQLGTTKNSVTAMERNGADLCIRKLSFPGLSYAKIKKGVFVGPQIRELIQGAKFKYQPSEMH